MSRALPGEHYCEKHQGNYSYYDPRNCTVCRLQREVERLKGLAGNFYSEQYINEVLEELKR